jgi:hypothetical protein
MTMLSDVKDRLVSAARNQGIQYVDGEDRPLAGYSAAMGTYAGLVAAIAAGVKASGVEVPDGLSLTDIALSAAATHKLSRLLAKDPVTSPLRAPFTSYRGPAGPAEIDEDVRGGGARKAVGELVTCPFCTGMWIATGLTAGLIFAPRATRLAIGTLAAMTGADLLQYAHAGLDKATS